MDEAALLAYAERTNAVIATLMEKDPGLSPVTAHIIAGDIISAEKATQMVVDGMPAIKAQQFVGSYARWDWIVTMLKAGAIDGQWFAENICELWQAADPDDTNPEYMRMWTTAKVAHGGYLRDGRPLPRKHTIEVFRGGDPATVGRGFAWSTDPKVATRFAITKGGRTRSIGGVVISGLVARHAICAYITGRNESEVIVDPGLVRNVRQVSRIEAR